MNSATVSRLANDWRAAGLDRGDVALIHSSLKRTLERSSQRGEPVTPEMALQSLLDVVGPEGTLLFPLFNFDFCRGVPFDIRSTRSQMGALTEAARQLPQAVRTGHPVYSFAVIGRHAAVFRDLCNASAYGAESPFQMLRDFGGKIGILNLPGQHSMTFYHHVEELHHVPYRFEKWFEGDYTGWDGSTCRKRFSIYVRDLERGIETHVEPAEDILWKQGFYRGDRFDQGTGFRTVAARDVFAEVSRIIESGRAEGLLYRVRAKEDA